MNKWSRYNQEDKWGCPKGHMKKGESFAQCAIREIYEETGLDIIITNATPYLQFQDTVYYLIRIRMRDNINAPDTKEVCEVCWKSFEELQHVNKNRALKFITQSRPETSVTPPFKVPLIRSHGPADSSNA